MRTLLAAALLAPSLALAQTPPPPLAPRPSVAPTPRGGARATGAPRAANPETRAPPRAGGPKPGNAAGTAHAEGKCTPLQGRFLLAFNKADIVDVIEQASRWTCRNFVFTDDVAKGKITLLSKTPVTAEEAYSAFIAALTANGIAVYPTGKYYKLVRIADSKKQPIPTVVGDGEAPASEQPVTKVIRLHYVDADQLRGVIANFTSPQGSDVQSIPPDVLVITDMGLNIRRIERLLDAIDKPGAGELIRVIQVQYAAAKDLADKINQVFQSGTGAPGRPTRRPVIGGPTPGAPGAAPGVRVGGEPTEVSKVLADERTNKLIVIADDKSFQRVLDLVKQLDLPTSGEGTIHVVFLKNANAEDLAQTLQALAQGRPTSARAAAGAAPYGAAPTPLPAPGAAPGAAGAPGAARPGGGAPTTAELFAGEVKITADKQQNALVVMASGSDFATLQQLIEKLDRPRRQVFVEAVIMEVDLNHENQFGISMHGALPYKTGTTTGFIPLASETGRIQSYNIGSLLSLGGFLTGLTVPASGDLAAVLPTGFPSAAVLVQALQTSSDVNVLSTPHVLASDNEESEISVGQNVPFQAGYLPSAATGTTTTTGTTATTTAASLLGYGSLLGGLSSLYAPIQRQNVELKLKLKPQISEGDMVRLDIEEQTEEIASKDPVLGPTTAKRSVKTKIVAKDQSTVVIGGLMQDRNVSTIHRIPLLGDIPVIGWLFRDTVTTKTKTNLLLFLTPYIIRDPADYRRILERKQREHQEFMEAFYGPQPKFEVAVDYARKAGPYTHIRKDIELENMKLENGGPGAPGERFIGPGESKGPPSGRTEHAPEQAEPPAERAPTEPTPPPYGAETAPPPSPPAPGLSPPAPGAAPPMPPSGGSGQPGTPAPVPAPGTQGP